MPLEIPEDLDLLTNIKAGLDSRIRILKEQTHILIQKNQQADLKQKQFYDLLIKELNDEIQSIKTFQEKIFGFIREKFDIEPTLPEL